MHISIVALLGLAVLGATLPTGTPATGVIYHCTVPNTVALTFDDGPWLYATDASDILTAANATGTFFYNGKNFDCIYNPDEVQRAQYVYGKGHQIASHTWSHPDLTKLNYSQIDQEMSQIEQAIVRITGAYPAFTRPPYGYYNDLVLQVAQKRQQTLVDWDFVPGDAVNASVQQQKQNFDNITRVHPSTILALNHETHETTIHQTLPYAIKKLQEAGYRLVSLAECLGRPAYKYVKDPATRDSTWHC